MGRQSTVGALGVGVVLWLGCGGGSGTSHPDPESAAIKALLSGLHFPGGVEKLGPIPPATDSTVSLSDAASFAALEPGESGLLPFDEDNPNAPDDASAAVLLQFGSDDRHLEVPTSSSGAGAGDINLGFELDTSVCEDLCNRRYTIEMKAAIELESGGIGALLESEVVLDCRLHGSEEHCGADEHSQPPSTAQVNPGPDEPGGSKDAGAGAGGTGAGGTGAGDDAGQDAGQDAGMPTSSLIDEEGGTVSLPDGAEAVVPPMAVSEPTPVALKVAEDTPPLPDDVEGAGEAYAFEPHGESFDEPVTIKLPFEGSSKDAQVLYLEDESDETWEEAEGTPSFDDGVAELEVNHFSIYQVVRPVSVADVDPCDDDNGGCDTSPMASCDSDGSDVTCDCPSGYSGDGVGDDGCEDILECADNNGDCGGGYACIEQVGDDPICDLDECTTNNGDCGPPAYNGCVNNQGAAPTCTDIDQCATNNGECGVANENHCTDQLNDPPLCTKLWAQIDVNDGPMCARRRNGTIECAGYDYTAGNAGAMTAAATDIIDVATGQGNACTVHSDHRLTCFGSTGGTVIPQITAAANNDPVQNFVDVEVGGYRVCALRTTGEMTCYGGQNEGTGSTNVRDFDVTWTHTCVVHTDGTLACFGTDTNGCVSGPNAAPGNPSDPANRYVSVATGNSGTCALRENGTFICWGSATPYIMDANADNQFDYVAISMGNALVCGLHADGTLSCWGADANGVVTDLTVTEAAGDIEQIGVGDYGSCILRTNGSMHCYGSNTYGFQGLNVLGAVP